MNIAQIPFIGEIMAITTAVIWAAAVILFKKSGETVHPIGLNLFKNSLGVLLLIPTLLFINQLELRDIPAYDYLMIFLSGAIGIGIADTFFFKSLNYLGAGLTAIVDCLYSPFVIGFSFLLLGESLSYWQIVGVLLILSAVLTATNQSDGRPIDKKRIIKGLLFGATAMFLTGFGVVIVKPVLEHEPLMWVTTLRLLSGVLVLLFLLFFNNKRRIIIQSLFKNGIRLSTVLGSFLGAYVAMILWLGGMKYTQASTAAALNQTNSIFIFIFAYFILKEKINLKKTIGIILAVAGALLVTFSS